MKIFIDSSAWADFFNDYPSPVTTEVQRLLSAEEDDLCTCGLVAAEVLQGLRSPRGLAAAERLLRGLVFLEPSGLGTYLRAAEIFRALRAKGIILRSTIDCVIVVIAEESRCWLLARDRDVQRIAASEVAKVSLWRPAG